MRRSDRLFDLIQILRDGRLHRAADLARSLGVSQRTIWRDMATLMATGLAVESEPGMGYLLRQPMTLPPMILTPAERDALRTGLRLVAHGTDPSLARAARSLTEKIATITPAPMDELTGGEEEIFATPPRPPVLPDRFLPLIRRAIRAREILTATYLESDGGESHGDIRPLAVEQQGQVLVLKAEMAGRTRALRLDRILALDTTGERFGADKR